MKARLHTAEHILYTVINNRFRVQSKALQFNDSSARVVYKSDSDLREHQTNITDEVNKIIGKNLPIISYELSRTEAAQKVDLVFVPETQEQINIYEIVGFNKLACIGPHVTNTSEIGTFQILKIEKKGADTYSIQFTIV